MLFRWLEDDFVPNSNNSNGPELMKDLQQIKIFVFIPLFSIRSYPQVLFLQQVKFVLGELLLTWLNLVLMLTLSVA